MTGKQAEELLKVLKITKKQNFILHAPNMQKERVEIKIELVAQDGKETILFLNIGRAAMLEAKRKCNFRLGSNTIVRIDYFDRHTNRSYEPIKFYKLI